MQHQDRRPAGAPTHRPRPRTFVLAALLAGGAALTLGAGPAQAADPTPTTVPAAPAPVAAPVLAPPAAPVADRVTVGRAVLAGDGLDVTVRYRCASPFGYNSLQVAATDSTRGGVFKGTLTPRCDGAERRAVVHAARVAGPASLPGHEAVVTASLGTDTGGLLFSPAVRGSGTRVLQQAG